jgi:hypothetical protein
VGWLGLEGWKDYDCGKGEAMTESVEEVKATTTKGGTKLVAPKIYGAMLAVAAGVGAIPRNGIMKFGGTEYKYVKNDDILDRISVLLVSNKIIVQPSVSIEDVNRGSRPFVYVHLTQTYISAEDGSSVATQVTGEAAAGDDKSVRKAVTQAQKIANLLTFSIATGEADPDGIEYKPTADEAPKQSPVANKITAAKGVNAESLFNEIKVFLGANEMTGAVANALGTRISGGKTSAEWQTDVIILGDILKALKAGEVE